MSYVSDFEAAFEKFQLGLKAERASLSANSARLTELRSQVKAMEDLVNEKKAEEASRVKELTGKEKAAEEKLAEATRILEKAGADANRLRNEAQGEANRAKSLREQAESDAEALKAEKELWQRKNVELKETFERIVR